MPPTPTGPDIDPVALRALLPDQVRNGVIVTDLDGLVIFWNGFATELYGWSAEEALGRHISELTVASSEAEHAAEIMASVTGGSVWNGEFRARRKDGSTFSALVSNTLLVNGEGVPIGVVGVSADLGALQQMEAEARRQAELAQVVLTSLPILAVVLDATGTVVAANQVLGDSTISKGVPAPEPGADYLGLCRSGRDVETSTRIADAIDHILRVGGTSSIEYPCSIDGRTAWFACEMVGLPDGGCVVMHRDVTETVEEREKLRRLAAEKDRFVAMISHEVRTPLTAVLGLAEELASATDLGSEQVHEFHQIIAEQAREVSSIIEDLLVVARIDNDSLTVVRQPIDVNTVVDSVLRPFQVTNGPIAVERPEGSVRAMGDSARLRQAVRNLVNNAVRHGAPPIGVVVDTSGEGVRILVFDNGEGIPADRLDVAFQPGITGSSKDPDSVGIGLSVTKALVERMGGSLEYRRNERTEFVLSLAPAD